MTDSHPLKKVRSSKRIEESQEDEGAESKINIKKNKAKGKKGEKGKKAKKGKRKESEVLSNEESDSDTDKENEIIQKKLDKLQSSENGLTTEQAKEKEVVYGRNEMKQKKVNPIWQLLHSFWNPLSWIMEIAVIVSIALLDYADFVLILVLLIVNALISYFESREASNAISELMKSLAPSCICYRDGETITTFNPAELVPGDIVMLRIGNIIPADCMLLQGETILVDQSAITGESLPSEKSPGSKVLSGSVIKRGEIKALVTRTGKNTVFGKAAQLTEESEKTSQFQRILTQVSWFCISFIVVGVIIELGVQFGARKMPCRGGSDNCDTLSNALVLIVGGIPVAMPTVLSITLALGASHLAKQGAIISRLSSIENLSGMDILCSDKTGTLTKNELSVIDPVSFSDDYEPEDILFLAALSVPADPSDPIDSTLIKSLSDDQKEKAKNFKHLKYYPFDPIEKFTAAKIKTPDGDVFSIRKGAPQNIIKSSVNASRLAKHVDKNISSLGKKGYRCIGISRSDGDDDKFYFIGLIPLFDPPRDDTQEMLEKTMAQGIEVKMVTGDQLAIAQETCRQLGLSTNIMKGEYVRDKQKLYNEHGVGVKEMIESAGGFAEVYPEDKFYIVKCLHGSGHIVGMTGDGVNDTAALKKSDIGIAVAGATDAARSAADIVILNPGLGVIVEAIIGSRKIFQRMKSYCIYSISMAVRTVILFVILTTVYNWYFPTIAVAILAILNDGCMISISRDRVTPSGGPDKWNPWRIFGSAIIYGIYLAISTIVLFEIVINTSFFQNTFGLKTLNVQEQVGLIYVQISIGGLALIFITRSYGLSFLDRPGLLVLGAFIVSQIISSVIGAYGLNGWDGFSGAGWGYVLVAWIWSLIWYIPLDCAKASVNALKNTNFWHDWKSFHGATLHPYRRRKSIVETRRESVMLSRSKKFD